MQLISLFSGIGGFELASEWMGWDNVVSCEINAFGQQVLKHYWPNAYHHDDIHTLTYEKIKEQSRWDENKPTVLVGGFPCQPYSAAGKRLGKDDDRHLWPQMLRVIREIQPTWIVGENVFGLVNWSDGLVFEEVQSDLETEGYEVQAYVLPAASVSAPHRRDRVWFVAHANHKGRGAGRGQVQDADGEVPKRHDNAKLGNAGNGVAADAESKQSERLQPKQRNISKPEQGQFRGSCNQNGNKYAANPCNKGLQRSAEQGGIRYVREKSHKQPAGYIRPAWDKFPTQSPLCSRDDGFPAQLVGITVSKHRNESIKAYGNAVVPQVVYQIFKAIQAYEDEYK